MYETQYRLETTALGGRFWNVREVGKLVRSPEEAAHRERQRELTRIRAWRRRENSEAGKGRECGMDK